MFYDTISIAIIGNIVQGNKANIVAVYIRLNPRNNASKHQVYALLMITNKHLYKRDWGAIRCNKLTNWVQKMQANS